MTHNILTRDALSSGLFLKLFEGVAEELRWDRARLEASLRETMALRPPGDEVWLFGYGSLIWNPLVHFDARRVATIHGWRRSFCMRTIMGRGSHDVPGRMLSLEAGGTTTGVAYRLPAQTLDEELALLWVREMLTGAYRPMWIDATFDDGRQYPVLVFVANPGHAFHEDDASVARVAPLISCASGVLGSNAEYVMRLSESLVALGVRDSYIEALTAELQALQQNSHDSKDGSGHSAFDAPC